VVPRALSVFVVLAGPLIAASVACGAPRSNGEPHTPADVQATSVRRTAAVEVQRIIANNPPPTATPGATPLPRPSCKGAIWWHEARTHVGESRTVQGPIVTTRALTDGSALLEIGQPYPDPTGLAVVVAGASAPGLSGKGVCVAGRIELTEGRPTIQVRNPSSVVVVE
jgi:hypothetical protein